MREGGLRAAKRAAVREDLARAAAELVRERGMSAVTVDDIAAAANVSRRTFFNYYSCKQEAVAALLGYQVGAALGAWHPPAGSGVVATLRDLVGHHVDAPTLAALVEVTALARGDEHIVPFVREAQWRMWTAVGERVLAALDHPGPDDRLDVQAATGALFSVVSHMLLIGREAGSGHLSSPEALRARLLGVLDRIAGGLDPTP